MTNRTNNSCNLIFGYDPPKPYVTDFKRCSNHINLKWEHKRDLSDHEFYQISFKEVPRGKWKVFSPSNPCRSGMVVINDLQAETSYVFKVRITDDNSGYEGPFSPESNIITTAESTALRIMKKSYKTANGPPVVYMLPLTENKTARNEKAQTKKLMLGSSGRNKIEKTVMMIGATGSDKSTLINSMANYVMGVTWDDPFRFTLVNDETCEQALKGNERKWLTCYTIYSDVSCRINYTINIIDTPELSSTDEPVQNGTILSQIRELFTAKGEKGVTALHAVCFVLKATDARLTTTQQCLYESILSFFGNNIGDNICTLLTFADCSKPPILAGLEALPRKPLPYKEYFSFNNCALFVNNTNNNKASFSRLFWNMNLSKCEKFFSKILIFETKSLFLTSEVLTIRQKLENTIICLQKEIDTGLKTIDSLEQEVAILSKIQRQINENKDYQYTVEEFCVEKVDISGDGVYSLICLVCNYTCQTNCRIGDDSYKVRGSCTACPKKCHWRQHSQVPFKFIYKTRKVTKSYGEMLSKYLEASKQKFPLEKLIQKRKDNIKMCECRIKDMIGEATKFTNRLKDIALCNDPLSTIEYFELMIENEKIEKKNGFRIRIQNLEEKKKRMMYEQNYLVFVDKLRTVQIMIAAM